jgi:hypothetical protein
MPTVEIIKTVPEVNILLIILFFLIACLADLPSSDLFTRLGSSQLINSFDYDPLAFL